jgi:hypothetical protein
MHDSLKGNTVGYQFVLAQSGRVFYSRGAASCVWITTRLGHSDDDTQSAAILAA